MDQLLRNIRTRDIIEKYNFRFNKGLGQNFLTDEDILNKIIDTAELTRDDNVLEIGPGIGSLTIGLSEQASKVLTIEIDNKLIPILNEVFLGTQNIVLYHGDAMKIDMVQVAREYLMEPITICANIPYYITTPLILKFFKSGLIIKNIVLMVQKEVAQRMAAKPGTKDYGALSLLVQYYSKPIQIINVPSSSFIPKPKVDSCVIKLSMFDKPEVNVSDEEMFFNVIRSSFNQRRKTLSNALKSIGLAQDRLMFAFESSCIDPKRRGETLTIHEFASLSNEICKLK